MSESKERPILFSGPMVKAILEGRKTQTRRIVKVQPQLIDGLWHVLYGPWDAGHGIYETEEEMLAEYLNVISRKCPYGKPGDRLWVRESGWERPYRTTKMLRDGADTWPAYLYSADGDDEWAKEQEWIRRPSIHMPRKASRITLEITNVRVERLQDISCKDINAEGVMPALLAGHDIDIDGDLWPSGVKKFTTEFSNLWDKINGKKHPWASNPWVWVVEFKKLEVPA